MGEQCSRFKDTVWECLEYLFNNEVTKWSSIRYINLEFKSEVKDRDKNLGDRSIQIVFKTTVVG